MIHWQRFLDSLDTPGGRTVTLFVLMVMGIVAYRNGFPKAEDVIFGAFGGLMMKLGSKATEPKKGADV